MTLFHSQSHAACGATDRTWDGSSNRNWNTAANWSDDEIPDSSSENAIIVSAIRDSRINADFTVGCVEVQSGRLQGQNNWTLTVTGDYFRALTTGFTAMNQSGFTLDMAGTAAQTLEMVDNVRNVNISNDTSVTFTNEFEITTSLTFDAAWAGTLYINDDLLLSIDSTMTIPTDGTVVIGNGVTVEIYRDLTVNGTLKLLPGAKVKMNNGRTITIASGALLQIQGAVGNVGTITSRDTGDDFDITVAGSINAEYFRIERINPTGVNITGTIQKMDHGEFHYLDQNGYAMTWGAAAVVPSTLDDLSFFNDDNRTNVQNIDATNYDVSDVTISNWGGSVGGEANNDDPNARITWVTPAATTLTITDNSCGGCPGNNINQDTVEDFGTVSFALSTSDTATDITEVKLTMIGSASTSDIEYIEVWRDGATSENCQINTGADVNMTGQVSLTGSPPSYTVSITAGDVQTSSDVDRSCIHIRAKTTTSAQDDKRIQFSVEATADVTNSESYSFSTAAGPPLPLGESRINGDAIRRWDGSASTDYNATGNWSGNTVPDSTQDCQIGSGANDAIVNIASATCQNATLPSGGVLDFNSTTNEFAVYGNLTVDTSYSFLNASTGVIAMRGAANQGLNLETSFPGEVTIANTGTSPNDVVSINSDSSVDGDITVSSGVLRVVSPNSLTVLGDLIISSGAAVEVEAGASLVMGNGSTIDVQSGSTLTLVGNSSQDATVTATGSNAYTVTVNGTIEARYYSFENLGTSGVSINSGATIDSTNFLQNGRFSNPINNDSTFLNLDIVVPGNTLTDMTFELGGSSATGSTSIDTTGVATTGTLILDGYTGDLAGVSYDNPGSNYLISWTGATNTIKVTQDATGPSSLDAGDTYTMGRFSFQQSLAGASYADTELTELVLTLTGTGSAADVDAIRIYSDSDCDSSGGTLIGSGTFSGVPESVTFTIDAGDFTIPADNTSPPERCIYVQYDIAPGATDGKTVGVEIDASDDLTNDQGYALAGSTPAPINLGTAGSIIGASITSWTGSTNSTWAEDGNWSAGQPDSTKTCQIDSAGNNPIVAASTTAACKNMIIGNGTLSLANSTATLEVHGNYSNSGTFTQNGGTLVLKDGGSSIDHTITSSSTIDELDIDKTGGGDIQLGSSSITITTLTLISSPTFRLEIPSSKTLILPNGLTLASGTIAIEGGGVLKVGDSQTLTVSSGATLELLGTSSSLARITAQTGASGFGLAINGTISANYYQLDRMDSNGLQINSGATINATNNLLNGSFLYPIANNSTLLTLDAEIPGDSIDAMTFDLDGSTATGTVNIDTTGITGGSDSLTITSYAGDVAGGDHDDVTGSSYDIIWSGASNTLLVTQEDTETGDMNAGSSYIMGRYGIQQKEAGASFSDVDITYIKLSLTGTATADDINEIRIYYDSNCDSTGGTLIGSGSMSGSPASQVFNLSASDFTVESHATTPPLRCFYVELSIANSATANATAGIRIATSSRIQNDLDWDIDSSVSFPITLGANRTILGASETTWVGGTSTDWETGGNWSSGVPTSTVNCIINNGTFDPIISTVDAACNNATINSGGSLTLNSGRTLEVHADFDNDGTFTHNGTLEFADGGSGSDQNLASVTTLDEVSFDKTSGGSVSVSGTTLSIDDLSIPGGSDFEFTVPSGSILTLANGLTLSAGTFNAEGGSTVKIGASNTVTVSGGTFKTSGTNDAYPQSTGNKALLTVDGSGTWTFSATSGNVELVGFLLDKLDTNGLQIGGTSNLTRFDGGQFTNLSTSYPVKALNLTTSTAVTETSPTNIGFYWDDANTLNTDSCCAPGISDTFYVVYASSCSNQLLAFDQWFGDFVDDPKYYDIEAKIYDNADGGTCQVTMNAADSAVDMLSMTATPHDAAAVLRWVTGQETNHAGFNVFRSQSPTSGYVQVNSSLIRNLAGSASGHGSYRFDDKNLNNGTAYYYMIQDVEWSGLATMHGPLSATPLDTLDGPPTLETDTNFDESDEAVEDTGIFDLGGGVKILSQTSNSFRLSIEPPSLSTTASTWDSSYSTITMDGYSKSLDSGAPELLQRTVLIEIKDGFSTVHAEEVELSQSTPMTMAIAPAPHWQQDDGDLVATYALGPEYSLNTHQPISHYEVASEIRKIAGKSYIEIDVFPVQYRASDENLLSLNRVVLDIGLDAQAWESPEPPAALEISPAAIGGNLRIRYQQSGMYRITFEDLVSAQVEGPFDGADTNTMMLLKDGEESALQIDSSTGFFSTGDSLLFYADFNDQLDDAENEVVLAIGGTPSKRIDKINAHPFGFPSTTLEGTRRLIEFEEDHQLRMEPSVGEGQDHLFWGWFWGPGGPLFDVNVDLPSIDNGGSGIVEIDVTVNGFSRQLENPELHLGVYLNGNPTRRDQVSFDSSKTHTVTLSIPAALFNEGANTLQFSALGDLIPAGSYNLIYLDKVVVDYPVVPEASGGQLQFENYQHNKAVEITGFTQSDVRIFDISYSDHVYQLSDVIATEDTGIYSFEFASVWGIRGRAGHGQNYLALTPDQFLSPTSMKLAWGYQDSLRDTSRGADLIVIGTEELLDAAADLITHRQADGLRVLEAPIEQIYAEFGNGLVSAKSIQDFLQYAHKNYESPSPQYALILGDGTEDPKDVLNRQPHRNTQPIYVVSGSYMDFGSDYSFGVDENGSPQIAVGRLPSSNPQVIAEYIEKLISYESGDTSPEALSALHNIFYAGTDKINDDFLSYVQEIQPNISSNNSRMLADVYQHELLSDPNQHVTDRFAQGPLTLTYFGHGAESFWAGPDPEDPDNAAKQKVLFTDALAENLNNARLPIVLAFNCWNNRHYGEENTIAESMIFSQGGAIAYWGSTTATIPPVQAALAQSFFNELSSETAQYYHKVRIGELMLRSQVSLIDQPAAADSVRSWTLFGDPSMKIPESSFVPQPLPPAADTPKPDTSNSVVVTIPRIPQPDPPANSSPKKSSSDSNGGGCAVALPPPSNGPGGPTFPLVLITPVLFLVLRRKLLVLDR